MHVCACIRERERESVCVGVGVGEGVGVGQIRQSSKKVSVSIQISRLVREKKSPPTFQNEIKLGSEFIQRNDFFEIFRFP